MKKSILDTKHNKQILIAGPCSAESRDQVLETSIRLAKTQRVHIIRAGIWKPRTMPGSFEGVGAVGLKWMQEVKRETGLPVTVEVAKPEHIDLCLAHDIDVLWIGARTTVSPFVMAELAEALQGVDIPVMVKNPINSDLKLWIGGIERIKRAGISEIAAIHRGFSYLGEKYYRNRPQWQIPIALKREMPDLPLICDPSHICGRRDILKEVSQKAMDLNFDGLMLESHIAPDEAWTDAKQQLTPEDYSALIDSLVLRNPTPDAQANAQLELLRSQISSIDDEVMQLLAQRMEVVRQIGSHKKAHNITILQQQRWEAIMKKGRDFAVDNQLNESFIERHFSNVHDESIDQQEKVMND